MFGAPKEKNTQFITNTRVVKINMNSASLSLAADIDLSFFFLLNKFQKPFIWNDACRGSPSSSTLGMAPGSISSRTASHKVYN